MYQLFLIVQYHEYSEQIKFCHVKRASKPELIDPFPLGDIYYPSVWPRIDQIMPHDTGIKQCHTLPVI